MQPFFNGSVRSQIDFQDLYWYWPTRICLCNKYIFLADTTTYNNFPNFLQQFFLNSFVPKIVFSNVSKTPIPTPTLYLYKCLNVVVRCTDPFPISIRNNKTFTIDNNNKREVISIARTQPAFTDHLKNDTLVSPLVRKSLPVPLHSFQIPNIRFARPLYVLLLNLEAFFVTYILCISIIYCQGGSIASVLIRH